jgi:hypothetical protein
MHPQLAQMLTDYYEGRDRLVHPPVELARTVCGCDPEGKLWEPIELGFGERKVQGET